MTINWWCSSSSESLEIAVMNDMRGQRRPYHNSAPREGSTSSGLGAASRHQLLGIPSRSLLVQLRAPSENNEVRIDSAPRVNESASGKSSNNGDAIKQSMALDPLEWIIIGVIVVVIFLWAPRKSQHSRGRWGGRKGSTKRGRKRAAQSSRFATTSTSACT